MPHPATDLPTDAIAIAAQVAAAPAADRTNILGEALYPLIFETEGARAGRITGMLLEGVRVPELLGMLESPAALRLRVEECNRMLAEHARGMRSGSDASGPGPGEDPEAEGVESDVDDV